MGGTDVLSCLTLAHPGWGKPVLHCLSSLCPHPPTAREQQAETLPQRGQADGAGQLPSSLYEGSELLCPPKPSLGRPPHRADLALIDCLVVGALLGCQLHPDDHLQDKGQGNGGSHFKRGRGRGKGTGSAASPKRRTQL